MSVTDALKVQFLPREKALLERRGSKNSDAYREYLLGRSQLNQRTGAEIGKAIESFSRPIGGVRLGERRVEGHGLARVSASAVDRVFAR